MSASLWKELVTLDGTHFADHFAIAYLAVSIVAVVGILYALSSSSSKSICYKGNDASLRKKAYDLLILSMLFYLLAYTFQLIDIILNEQQVSIRLGYKFVSVFRDGCWQVADFVILTIACRVTYYQFPNWGAHKSFHATWRFFCEVFLTVLAALAIYRWALSTAYTTLTLNNVSSSGIQHFTRETEVLRAGYQILYMLVSTLILLLAVYYLYCRIGFSEKPDKLESGVNLLTIILWIRSVSRVGIVVKYTLLESVRPVYIEVAAEAAYGLPTVAIYIILNRLRKHNQNSAVQSDILRDGRRAARRELHRRRLDAKKGGPPLPTPAQLLTEIESKPLAYLPRQLQESVSSLTQDELQVILQQHVQEVLKFREKI